MNFRIYVKLGLLMILSAMFMMITGCASMIHGQQQTIHIKSHDDATIFIDGRFAGQGIAQRKVTRDDIHEIIVEHNDCQMRYQTESRFNKISLLGVFLDLGLVSIPTDFLTGAAWQVSPSRIKLIPECDQP